MTEKELIETFYQAFQRRDWKTMQSCYADDVVFTDPVFPRLEGPEAKAMWHMLTTSAKDLVIEFRNVSADSSRGSCDWDARYSFSRTGRSVHNRIHAEFEFAGGKITHHTDTFDLARWAGMALGWPGKILGWTPWMQEKIRGTARTSLAHFLKANAGYPPGKTSQKA
jgi:ketosteroid isomerase-like protein